MIIKEQLLLDVMLKVLPYEINQLNKAGLKMGHIYTARLQKAIDECLKKQNVNKRALDQGNTRIVEMITAKGSVTAAYLHNGYEYIMTLIEDTLKSETEIRLAEILNVDLTLPDPDEGRSI